MKSTKDDQETEKLHALSRVQMAALVSVVSAKNKAEQIYKKAMIEQEGILNEITRELGFGEGAVVHITPELQARGLVKIFIPGDVNNA